MIDIMQVYKSLLYQTTDSRERWQTLYSHEANALRIITLISLLFDWPSIKRLPNFCVKKYTKSGPKGVNYRQL